MNILKAADDIVNNRSEEKSRQYGPFNEGMSKTAKMASLMSNKKITEVDVYNVMIALKLTREAHCHKEDNLLDAVAYIGSLNNMYSEFYSNSYINYKFFEQNKVIIVGERPLSSKGLEEKVAFLKGRSSKFINEVVKDHTNIILTNAINTPIGSIKSQWRAGKDQLMELINENKPTKIICLGSLASSMMDEIGSPFNFDVFKLKHPSYILRFNKGVDEYRNLITNILTNQKPTINDNFRI